MDPVEPLRLIERAVTTFPADQAQADSMTVGASTLPCIYVQLRMNEGKPSGEGVLPAVGLQVLRNDHCHL